MPLFCDLHTHSVFSDGTFTPEEIIQASLELRLSAVALCDHNTAEGLPRFLEAAAGKEIEAVCGSEFSVDYRGRELHLLGLFIAPDTFSQVSDLMKSANEAKEHSNIALVESLNRAGYPLDYAAIKAKSPSGKINRAHIAAELTQRGYTQSVKHAFETLLSVKTGHYVEPKRISFFGMIDFIRQIHAVPVLAHPFLNLSPNELAELLPIAKRRGLAGMECVYSTFSRRETDIALFLAAQNRLLPSGGSDFHGSNKPDIQLGAGRGSLQIPAQWAVSLKKAGQ